jgi:hypothetical protein
MFVCHGLMVANIYDTFQSANMLLVCMKKHLFIHYETADWVSLNL